MQPADAFSSTLRYQRTAPGSGEPVGIVPRIAAVQAERVAVATERGRKGYVDVVEDVPGQSARVYMFWRDPV